jgi:hypothetical protein
MTTSLVSLAISAYAEFRDRSHLKLSTAFALRTSGENVSDDHVLIHIANDGRYAEIVTGVGFASSNGKRAQFVKDEHFIDGGPLPRRLEPGEGTAVLVHAEVIRRQWKKEIGGRLT